MTGWWLASYMVLWGAVVLMGLFLLGTLREVGALRRRAAGTNPAVVPLAEDGPRIGSFMPDLVVDSINGHGVVALREPRGDTGMLLVFMSPMCEGCQHVIDPLNAVLRDPGRRVRVLGIMRGDESACKSFLGLFPLLAPVVRDELSAITRDLGVHRNPLGLLYDEHGTLVRKGAIVDGDDVAALLGSVSVPASSLANVYPKPAPLHAAGLSDAALTTAGQPKGDTKWKT